MKKNKGQPATIPEELQGVATTGDVSALEGKVDKCYSEERYKDFQTAVEEIISRYLKGQLGWAVLLWLITLIASMLAEKFLHVF